MDSLITAAARALAAGDSLGALKRVALRDDAPALALRGIAMAQLGDFTRAKLLLRRAARAFGAQESIARARCMVAEAEIALVSRELGGSTSALDDAIATLEAHGDRANAAHARYLKARRQLLIGRVDDAESTLADLDVASLRPSSRASFEMVAAGIAMKRLQTVIARAALRRASDAAQLADIPALIAEVHGATRGLDLPAAQLIERGENRLLRLDEVEALLNSETLVVDACRYAVRRAGTIFALERRPVLFALARLLGEAWPGDATRAALIAQAFHTKHADESHRARLRVEIGRLRSLLRSIAHVHATKQGFMLAPHDANHVVVLAHPTDESHAAVLALLADGEAWSSSALALALDTSQRSVQRALDALATKGKVDAFGRGRSRRWVTQPMPGFPTSLLLPPTFPDD
ncbi:helix-turn-helix domain-containing protein [Rhodanobacter sp. L36]|uniref:helix-turn-helix domain-containing protein n=1 Tax=Rhodanobacter sp. L36 TaxID=1747221 RepID=UPI00131D02FF|nr:helix-turn-helix domain-containing protein [Rhodanobacter sp. L36]